MLGPMRTWLRRRQRARALGGVAAAALGCNRSEGVRVMQAMLRANLAFIRQSHRLSSVREYRLPVVTWHGAEAFRAAVSRDGRPLLLATLHMGNYLHHLLALAPHLTWLGRVTLLRRTHDSDLEAPLQARASSLGLELRLVHTGQHPGRTALRALSRGEHVLLLYDVPPSFDVGRTMTASLLGHPAALPAGPALLCRAGNALLWPFCVLPDGKDLLLHSRDPFPVRSAADVEPAIHTLARFAESAILAAPEQWLLWAHLSEMWSRAASLSADRVAQRPPVQPPNQPPNPGPE